MATLFRNDRSTVPPEITMVQGNALLLKVLGLGPNKKHLVFKGNQPSLLRVEAINPNHRNKEQSIRLVSIATNSQLENVVEVAAYVDEDPLMRIDGNTRRLRIKILPGLQLPHENTEAGLLARVFLAETVGPDDSRYGGRAESVESMRWIKRVLQNRLDAGAHHFSLNPGSVDARSIRTLQDVVKARGQVESFEMYPVLRSRLKDRIDSTTAIANDASDKRHRFFRQYVNDVISVAQSVDVIADPCPTGLYAWRTHEADSPGPNFAFFRTMGGQDFYTLTPAYRANVLKIR
ncbi:hypothetical protein [Achromobacter sp.]|uniref:hypothetical protein n=1 Tax=Achromobacter sp. TaxID=134375 RepID=UPI0028A7E11C|nr:hypothetical protein [Achromobacter sp.]